MAQNTKTPAMVLQEFTVKRGISPPEYITEHSKTGTHINEFYYRVEVADIVAKGFGRSKQVAKHNAASRALQLLAEQGLYNPEENPVQEFNAQSHRNESDSPFKPATNFIGTLKDLCSETKLPQPIFEEISDVGPPHCRIFTYRCILDSIKTQATANTKKQAKQLAAKDMLDKVKEMYPLAGEQGVPPPPNALPDTENVIKKYLELTDEDDVVPNRAAKVADFILTIKKIMVSKDLTIDDFADEYQETTLENLEKICEKLGIKFKLHPLLDAGPSALIALNLCIDTPFTVIASGRDMEDAKNRAIIDTFKHLKIHMEAKLPND